MEKKVVLCGSCSSCPAVEFKGEGVFIGENENLVKLSREEWNILVDKVKKGELTSL